MKPVAPRSRSLQVWFSYAPGGGIGCEASPSSCTFQRASAPGPSITRLAATIVTVERRQKRLWIRIVSPVLIPAISPHLTVFLLSTRRGLHQPQRMFDPVESLVEFGSGLATSADPDRRRKLTGSGR